MAQITFTKYIKISDEKFNDMLKKHAQSVNQAVIAAQKRSKRKR